MKKGEAIHLGDGVYVYFNGYGIELRANHHEHPTDTVCLDSHAMRELKAIITSILNQPDDDRPKSTDAPCYFCGHLRSEHSGGVCPPKND